MCISLLFVCCQSFKMIPDIYELLFCPPTKNNRNVCEAPPFISTCVSLSHLLICGNSALNWIVYLLAGEKFRSAWCKTYLPRQCIPKRLLRPTGHTTYHSTIGSSKQFCTKNSFICTHIYI